MQQIPFHPCYTSCMSCMYVCHVLHSIPACHPSLDGVARLTACMRLTAVRHRAVSSRSIKEPDQAPQGERLHSPELLQPHTHKKSLPPRLAIIGSRRPLVLEAILLGSKRARGRAVACSACALKWPWCFQPAWRNRSVQLLSSFTGLIARKTHGAGFAQLSHSRVSRAWPLICVATVQANSVMETSARRQSLRTYLRRCAPKV